MEKQKYKNKTSFFERFLRILLKIILFPLVIAYLINEKIKKSKLDKINAEKIKVYNISQLDFLSGREFEQYLKSLFENMGFEVTLTKLSGDYGVDLIISKKGKQSIVQAKCYNHTVGVKAVQEIVAGREHYKIYDAMVITNNYFSREAENLALETGVTLVDRIVLEKMVRKYDVRIEKTSSSSSALSKTSREEIFAKYRHWI